MDLARRVDSRELKLAAMREIDSGRTISEVTGKDSLFGLCPHFLRGSFLSGSSRTSLSSQGRETRREARG